MWQPIPNKNNWLNSSFISARHDNRCHFHSASIYYHMRVHGFTYVWKSTFTLSNSEFNCLSSAQHYDVGFPAVAVVYASAPFPCHTPFCVVHCGIAAFYALRSAKIGFQWISMWKDGISMCESNNSKWHHHPYHWDGFYTVMICVDKRKNQTK